MTRERRKQIQELLDTISPLPWKECGSEHGGCSCGQICSVKAQSPVATVTIGEWGDPGLSYGKVSEEVGKANARFIANAPSLVKELLAEIDRLLRGRP